MVLVWGMDWGSLAEAAGIAELAVPELGYHLAAAQLRMGR